MGCRKSWSNKADSFTCKGKGEGVAYKEFLAGNSGSDSRTTLGTRKCVILCKPRGTAQRPDFMQKTLVTSL